MKRVKTGKAVKKAGGKTGAMSRLSKGNPTVKKPSYLR